MRTIDQHQDDVAGLVEAALASRPSERLPLDPAAVAADPDRYRRRELASDVVAPIDLPPFANSQMDGFAVSSSDVVADASLVVVDRIPAGRVGPALLPGTAAPIMTGAAVPDGADAVVPVERVEPPLFPAEGVDARVAVTGPVAAGAFVREAGSDVVAGSVLLPAGTIMTPARWGVLAAAGLGEVAVRRRPRLLLVSTGEELAAPGAELGPGEIHDANGVALAAALAEVGVEVVAERVTDDAATLTALVARHAADVDLVVTTGGVSAGAYEVVRDAFETAGVVFGSVAMQPGGPQGHGPLSVGDRRLPAVCFPGNPVSALVSFEVFLRPLLQAATGVGRPRARTVAPMAEPAESPVGKHQLRRGRLDADGRVALVGGAGSHLLSNHAAATLLVHLPVGVERVEAGDDVVVWALDD
ncbi:molybdopterin molybdotransferase MoeA [Frigoribacterium sp. Leaf263]|uniref:molybdopterin molybdotransferase MoeA n=1 Tax=Frigoribacterium sp. Leaf263 TaxID=1736313 RepID=UPI000A4541E4|nr:gephyrin-like molybdotransferase Glp [Frigoribacterium sp. Leaf263]